MKLVLSLGFGGLITWGVKSELYPDDRMQISEICEVVFIFGISASSVLLRLQRIR